MAAPEPQSSPPEDVSAEIARLEQELARLKGSEPTKGRRGGWWRSPVVGLLVLLVAVLAPLSVLSTWASGQISDTDRYLATVAPLADDPDVQAAVARRLEDVVFTYLDIEAVTDEIVTALEDRDLPPAAATALRALAGPLEAGVRDFVGQRIEAIVRSDAFATAWTEANRTAHEQLVAALLGETDGAVQVDRGAVSVDLAVLINTVKLQLVDAGFAIAERIPEVDATFAIVQSDDLARLQTLLGLLDDLSTWIPVIGLLLLGLAIVVARDRRRVVLAAGLAVAAAMLLLGATLNVLRPIYLDALPASSSAAAAGAIYDQLVSFIRLALRGLLVVALTVAVVAWMSAQTGSGAAARRGLNSGIGTVRRGVARGGLSTGRFGEALGQFRGPIRAAVVGLAAVGYLAQDHPTGGTAVTFVVVTALVLLVVEVLAVTPERESPDAPVGVA